MPAVAVPLIISGVSALASWLSNRGNKKQTSTTDETQTNTPLYDPNVLSARNSVLQSYMDRMNNYKDYMQAYTGQGMRKINQGADIQRQSLENILSARGLAYSPVSANLLSRGENDRISQLINFENQAPILERQLQGEDLQGLGSYIASLPTGMTTTRKGTSTGVQNNPSSNAIGGALSDSVSSYLLAKYYQDKNKDPYANV